MSALHPIGEHNDQIDANILTAEAVEFRVQFALGRRRLGLIVQALFIVGSVTKVCAEESYC